MSIPLHQLQLDGSTESDQIDINKSLPQSENACKNKHVDDLFLDSEERYEIYLVKAAERPHLLEYVPSVTYPSSSLLNVEEKKCCTGFDATDDDKIISDGKDSYSKNNDQDILPLIDGCDIPGWRKENFIVHNQDNPNYSFSLQALLNVGASSTMFRRDKQWPNFLKMIQNKKWNELKVKLVNEPTYKAKVVEYEDYCQMQNIYGNQDNIEKINRKATKFAVEFEQGNIPAKIMGATNDWKCMYLNGRKWTFENLLKRYGNIYWRFSDTHGEMMALSTYAKYISNAEGIFDDSPLGIYDSEFGDSDSPTSDLLEEYSVPQCFSPDIFDLTIAEEESGQSRPPFRWILIGPERSGTGLHVDPLWTNAWVTVIEGKKRWLLFPPTTPKEDIGMRDDMPQINSATWFHSYYDLVTSEEWPLEYKPVEVLQYPGETVFVPNGWPHIVLNLERTIAVTHNYASEYGPFERMWREVAQDEPEFAERWIEQLKTQRPDLYARTKIITMS